MATMTMPTTTSAVTTDKLVSRFRTWADALQSKIDYACRPMTQNPTPKRNREYQYHMHEGRNLERTQKALRTLADAREHGTVPPALADLKTKNDIGAMVHKSADSSTGGYYSCIEADDYQDTSEAARQLQAMIEGSSHEQAERERLRKIDTLEAEIALSTIPGYFPTPAPVVDLMLQRARISDGMKVLEPSAGSGHIADAIRAAHPGAWIDTIEIASPLRDILVLKNYRVMAFDFLDFENDQERPYDRIVMNPPFERQQDIAHVRMAYSLLAPGGVLVTIMSPSFEFRNDRKSTEFRAWLETINATWENLPEGSFKASGTGVSTRLLTIERN